MTVKRPYISYVSLNSNVATISIGNYISDFSYTEEPGFGRSHCEFTFEPKGTTVPSIGDSIEIQVKYKDDPTANFLTTGTHIVNDIVYDHGKKIFNIGMSAYTYNGGAYSQAGYSYDTKNIRQIVDTQAGALGLTVNNLTGISTAIAGFWTRVETAPNSGTYNYYYRFSGDTRAEILEKLARDYGFLLRVKGGTLFFYDLQSFVGAAPAIYLTPVDLTSDASAQSRQTTDGIYSTVRVWYSTANPASASPTHVVEDLLIANTNVSGRLLNTVSQGLLYSQTSADRFAYGVSKEANRDQDVLVATAQGNYRYVLGAIVQLSSFDVWGTDRFNNKYFLRKAVHTLRRSDGWRTMLELQRVW